MESIETERRASGNPPHCTIHLPPSRLPTSFAPALIPRHRYPGRKQLSAVLSCQTAFHRLPRGRCFPASALLPYEPTRTCICTPVVIFKGRHDIQPQIASSLPGNHLSDRPPYQHLGRHDSNTVHHLIRPASPSDTTPYGITTLAQAQQIISPIGAFQPLPYHLLPFTSFIRLLVSAPWRTEERTLPRPRSRGRLTTFSLFSPSTTSTVYQTRKTGPREKGKAPSPHVTRPCYLPADYGTPQTPDFQDRLEAPLPASSFLSWLGPRLVLRNRNKLLASWGHPAIANTSPPTRSWLEHDKHSSSASFIHNKAAAAPSSSRSTGFLPPPSATILREDLCAPRIQLSVD